MMKSKCSLEMTVFEDGCWKGCPEDLTTSKSGNCREGYPELEIAGLWEPLHPEKVLVDRGL